MGGYDRNQKEFVIEYPANFEVASTERSFSLHRLVIKLSICTAGAKIGTSFCLLQTGFLFGFRSDPESAGHP